MFEAILDEIAEKLGIDPWELRLRNALGADKPTIYGAKIGEAGIQECIDWSAIIPTPKPNLAWNQAWHRDWLLGQRRWRIQRSVEH